MLQDPLGPPEVPFPRHSGGIPGPLEALDNRPFRAEGLDAVAVGLDAEPILISSRDEPGARRYRFPTQ